MPFRIGERLSSRPATRAAAATVAVCLLAGVPQAAGAQTAEFLATDAISGRIVRGAPFSADGTTSMTQTLADGTRIERIVPSKFFRDSAGRVRREQTMLGLGALSRSADSPYAITIADPLEEVSYALNPVERVARRTHMPRPAIHSWSTRLDASRPRANRSDGAPLPSPPQRSITFTVNSQPDVKNVLSTLEPRQIEGLAATGHRTISTFPIGAIGNDRPIEVTSERWVSDDLGIVLLSRDHDPRTGTVEFRLTNIQRAEPPRELFTVPSDYKIVDAPPSPFAPPAR